MVNTIELKATARARVAELVEKFRRNEADYLSQTYNETQARTDFITPLLQAFGWDVYNEAERPIGLREVIEEATVEVEEGISKRPDYELRVARQRKLFVEAKKPSVAINQNRASAFQVRRYGYSASLPVSILTSFHQLAIYDCSTIPEPTDEAHVARILLIGFDEFETRFEELWPILARQSVYSGEFDRLFAVGSTRRGAEQFDDFFLKQVKSWRKRLALDIYANTPTLTPQELTYSVQLFISRIVFLRICEDREIERYENLKNLPAEHTFDALMVQLRRADKFYNSGLFCLIDDAALGIHISDKTLLSIINELYYPHSPYTFAVVETEILGEIYEQFLGDEISIKNGNVSIVNKPEVRESGGVIPTPRYIVDAIVARTIGPMLEGKSPDDLINFTVVDTCCGSGIFLLGVYEFFLEYYLNWYLTNPHPDYTDHVLYEVSENNWKLSFEEKRRILQRHIRGVDIDANAVEIAQFSMLLKLIENEKLEDLNDYVRTKRERALPDLADIIRAGNSLVSRNEWKAAMNKSMPEVLNHKINPFDWRIEFPMEMNAGGFDAVVGNPPYIRIQHMTKYSPEEVAFYKSPSSPYVMAQQDNFDKYALFFERSLSLIKPSGRLGFITPHKFMTIQTGLALRRLLTTDKLLESIIHFGAQQVFGHLAKNYTSILILDKNGSDHIQIEQVSCLEEWRYGHKGCTAVLPADALGDSNWNFQSTEARAVFDRILTDFPTRLENVAEIFVGLQTSADDIYIFKPSSESTNHYTLNWDGKNWPIEKEILRPFMLDVQVSAYSSVNANSFLIFPYKLETIRGKTQARLIQPDEMATLYPLCFSYLNARRKDLEKRSIQGGKRSERQFYQYGRSQSLTKFDGPKIILPALSLEPRYAYDNKNITVTGGGNGPYYLLRQQQHKGVSDYYLLAVLNHPLSEAFVRTNTSVFGGGYYSHGKQFIKDLPVPIPSKDELTNIDSLVIQLISANDKLANARTPRDRTFTERLVTDLHQQVEDKITKIFKLTPTELNAILAVPPPN